jgi:nitrogen fixation NifU-like protein
MTRDRHPPLALSALYQEVIVDHFRNPRFKKNDPLCRFCQEGKNPLCGDSLTIFCQVNVQKEVRLCVSFDGSGCSLSQASASMMCAALQHVTLEEARKFIDYAQEIYTGKWSEKQNHKESLEDALDNDLEALAGVSKFPVRIKCVALAWKTLHMLLEEHFDAQGQPQEGCDKLKNCAKRGTGKRKLKVVTTEM